MSPHICSPETRVPRHTQLVPLFSSEPYFDSSQNWTTNCSRPEIARTQPPINAHLGPTSAHMVPPHCRRPKLAANSTENFLAPQTRLWAVHKTGLQWSTTSATNKGRTSTQSNHTRASPTTRRTIPVGMEPNKTNHPDHSPSANCRLGELLTSLPGRPEAGKNKRPVLNRQCQQGPKIRNRHPKISPNEPVDVSKS